MPECCGRKRTQAGAHGAAGIRGGDAVPSTTSRIRGSWNSKRMSGFSPRAKISSVNWNREQRLISKDLGAMSGGAWRFVLLNATSSSDFFSASCVLRLN